MLTRRKLGRTGVTVTEIGFGGIPIQRISERRAVKLVSRSIDMGINFIDTHRDYGDSEKKIGKAIKGRRDDVYVSTKSHARDPEGLRSDLENSLSSLGVSRVDLYFLHGVNTIEDLTRVTSRENLEFLQRMKDEGMIRFLGVSGHLEETMLKAIDTGKFDVVMFPFNYVVPDARKATIPICQERNIGFVCMKPFAGGMLDNSRSALAYVLKYPISTAIPGMALIRELKQNTMVSEKGWLATDEEAEKLEALGEEIGERFCRNCGYCIPCPQGVEIASLVRLESWVKRIGWRKKKTKILQAVNSLDGCIRCKECEEKCPYNLPIVEMMNEQSEWLLESYPSILA